MSVPTWKRKPSKMEFLNKTLELETMILQMVVNTSKKYQDSIGAMLIHDCDEALRHGKVANAIYVMSRQDLDNRSYELNQMRGAIDTIPCHIHIWAKVMKDSDAVSRNIKSKLQSKEERVAKMCELILRLIDGLKKSDRQRFKKHSSGNLGCPDNFELPISKEYNRHQFKMLSHLRSIAGSLINMQISKEPAVAPEDLPEYRFNKGLRRRLEIEEKNIIYNKDNPAE